MRVKASFRRLGGVGLRLFDGALWALLRLRPGRVLDGLLRGPVLCLAGEVLAGHGLFLARLGVRVLGRTALGRTGFAGLERLRRRLGGGGNVAHRIGGEALVRGVGRAVDAGVRSRLGRVVVGVRGFHFLDRRSGYAEGEGLLRKGLARL